MVKMSEISNTRTRPKPLVPGWPMRRIVVYMLKLGIFACVPGLYLSARSRYLPGVIFLTLFAVSSFVVSNGPPEFAHTHESFRFWSLRLAKFTQIMSWLYLAYDLRCLEQTSLKLWHCLPLLLILFLQQMPLHDFRGTQFFVQQGNDACPAICAGDAFEWVQYDRRYYDLKVGEHVVIQNERGDRPYGSKIYAVPTEIECPLVSESTLNPEFEKFFCYAHRRKSDYLFVIFGGQGSQSKEIDGQIFSIVQSEKIKGVQPKKIGNVREHFFLSNKISKIVGRAYLLIYKWTGINLF